MAAAPCKWDSALADARASQGTAAAQRGGASPAHRGALGSAFDFWRGFRRLTG
eukprot:CAMPEP_0195105902 /NCGR_PEP_ID=MMETSP0448-20130528/78459_1 /TAXON_ID=66468 /ORGANISM="Heterocapsa triquestra, Strain CCMP 448" /LENGTH=52 /DNA_ID=CAMNT_0040142025 /DNA_START=146 /DNA_END=304 /DNA_ORIENTATION=-